MHEKLTDEQGQREHCPPGAHTYFQRFLPVAKARYLGLRPMP